MYDDSSDDGSSSNDGSGTDPMDPQLPDETEYTVATPVLPADAY